MKSIGLVGLVLAFAVVGCSDGSTVGVAQVDEGAGAEAALASADVHDTLCPVKGGTYSRGVWKKPDERLLRSASPVVYDELTPPRRLRRVPSKPWSTKAPIAVRLDGKPVEIAVLNSDGAEVGLEYDDWGAQFLPEAAYQRIRFLPCKGDKPEPTWYGWPGVIVADRRDVCLQLAVREDDGAISLLRVPLGDGCSDSSDR